MQKGGNPVTGDIVTVYSDRCDPASYSLQVDSRNPRDPHYRFHSHLSGKPLSPMDAIGGDRWTLSRKTLMRDIQKVKL